ncbi:MAG: DUF4147 domain-containing protein [Thermoanaerobaculia bacterium]
MSRLDRLKSIYRRTLEACAPETLVRDLVGPSSPRDVVAIGKCAGSLFDGVAASIDVRDALVVIPEGYRPPATPCELLLGGHPEMTTASFQAGRRLREFVSRREEILFLISGGGSACVEAPLEPWFDERVLAAINARLVAAGPPIADINCVRKHLSAIKGGRLASRLRRSVTLIFSDVSTGRWADVASGPTMADDTTNDQAAEVLDRIGGFDEIAELLRSGDCPETMRRIEGATSTLIADNDTLVAAAESIARSEGLSPVRFAGQIESDVAVAAGQLHDLAARLRPQEVLIAGGEPTVERRGSGRGGRCMEMAVRFAMLPRSEGLEILMGSSDGVDGNSGAAGIAAPLPARLDRARVDEALQRSASMEIAELMGEPLKIPPTGNNLRDLYLLTNS